MARTRRHRLYARRIVDSDSDSEADAESPPTPPPSGTSGTRPRSPVIPRGEPSPATFVPVPTPLPAHSLGYGPAPQVPAHQAGPSLDQPTAQTTGQTFGRQQKPIVEGSDIHKLTAQYFESGKTHPPMGAPYWVCGVPGCGRRLQSTGQFDVQRHLRIHLPHHQQIFFCRVCGLSSAQKHNILAHERTHAKEADKSRCDIVERGVRCQFRWTDPSARTHHRQNRHGWLTREEGCMARLKEVWLPRTRATQAAWSGRDRMRPELEWPSASYNHYVVPTFPPSQRRFLRMSPDDLAPQSQLQPPDADDDMGEGDDTVESRGGSPSPSVSSRRPSPPPQAGPSRPRRARTHRASSSTPSSSSADHHSQFADTAPSMRLPSFGEFVSRSSVPPPAHHHHSSPVYPSPHSPLAYTSHHSSAAYQHYPPPPPHIPGMPSLDPAQWRFPPIPPPSASSGTPPAPDPRFPPFANFPRHTPSSTTPSLSPSASPQLSEATHWSVPSSVAHSPSPYPPWYSGPSGSVAGASSRRTSSAYDLAPVDSWSPQPTSRVYHCDFAGNDPAWSENIDESDWSEPSAPEANAKGKGKKKDKGKRRQRGD